ncbi:M20/M25/M40 family metallo-hydrolase [soil metagenome]
MQRSIVTIALAWFALGACAPATSVRPLVAPIAASAAATRGAETITATDMYARIAFLASDALKGRDTPSQGLDAAAAYLVSEHRRLGLEPAGENGTFYQMYPFGMRRLDAARTGLRIRSARGEQMLRYGQDFFVAGGTTADLEGGLVFAGREIGGAGASAATYRDRIVLTALPGEFTRDFRLLRTQQATAAEREGARAVIHVLDRSWTRERIAEFAGRGTQPARALGERPGYPQFLLSYAAAERLFAAGGLRLDELYTRAAAGPIDPVSVPGLTATAGAPQEALDRAMAPNVVAVLRGSDPVLRNEYVVLSAHMDHVGVGEPVNGDSIYNGADDDASGTAALVEIAEAMASLPVRPRRSVIFLHVSGEEKGLLGSRWYSDHPTVPLQQIVANVNIDMISRNSPDTVVVIGKDYSTLGAVVNRVGARHPELRLTAADDIWPEERFFFRSDHFNFARKEIPAIFFFTGVHEDYHRPSDTVEKIDSDKAMRVTRLIFHTVMEIANADARPTWDLRGLEEVRRLTR